MLRKMVLTFPHALVYKLLVFIAITTMLPGFFCGKNCDSYDTVLIRGPIQDYFGAYKPGNWWVYQNKNGARKDSIYIMDYTDTVLQDRTVCLKYEQRMFTIKNNILMNGNNLYVNSSADKVSVDMNFSLVKYQTQSGGFPQFIHNERDSKLSSFPASYNQGNNVLDSITLNNTTYYNILQGKYSNETYYFAKNKGLVGWIANGEAFNLTTYKIL